jgi:hypothetical protein
MKVIIIFIITINLFGCGWFDSEVCIDNVKYIQFTSGASVKYNSDGSIAQCR